MLCPSVLPDEFVLGYKGRILQINKWSSPKEGVKALRAWFVGNGCSRPRREVLTVEILASVAALEMSRLLRNHSLLPLRRGIARERPGIPHGSLEHAGAISMMGMCISRSGAYFCAECVEEDHESHGMPYWHRDHQITGLYWCRQHDAPLNFIESRDAFLSSPATFLNCHQSVSGRWAAMIQKNPLVQRYLDIADTFLTSLHPLDERNVSKVLRVRAAENGFQVNPGAVFMPLLNDLLKQQFDAAWLESVVPGLASRRGREYWYPVDGATLGKRTGISTIVYALAFAALYDSATDAIKAMGTSPASRKYSRPLVVRNEAAEDRALREAYFVANGNHAAVARPLSISKYQITERLNKMGLPPLGIANIAALNQVIQAVLSCDTPLSVACAANGLAKQKVAMILHRAMMPLINAIGRSDDASQSTEPKVKRITTLPPKQRAEVKDDNDMGNLNTHDVRSHAPESHLQFRTDEIS